LSNHNATQREPNRLRRIKRRVFRALVGALPIRLSAGFTRRFAPKLRRYLPGGHELVVDDYLGEFRVAVDMTYPVEREMFVNWYEPDAVALIDSLVGDGDVCLDIGANVGALTIAIARRVGPTGHVYAFEPGTVTYPRLVRNLEMNPSIGRRVVPLRLGVSDQPGTLYWNEEAHNRGNATLYESSGTPVPVVTIDGHFAGQPLQRLDFVKIDVEGMEYEVLSGARRTLLAHRPVIYLETLPHFASIRGFPVRERIEELLRELGYALYGVREQGRLTAVTASNMSAYTLAVPASHPTLVDGAPLPGMTPSVLRRLAKYGVKW
jgi:FkbM family methyltransferase